MTPEREAEIRKHCGGEWAFVNEGLQMLRDMLVAYDAVMARERRLREALEKIEVWLAGRVNPPCEVITRLDIVRAALATTEAK
jgi:hypothetical protein